MLCMFSRPPAKSDTDLRRRDRFAAALPEITLYSHSAAALASEKQGCRAISSQAPTTSASRILVRRVVTFSSPGLRQARPRAGAQSQPPASAGVCELACPHFSVCSGCTLEHGVDQPSSLQRARQALGQFGISDFQSECGPIHSYRMRARLAVRGTSSAPVLGLFKQGSHEAISIPSCRIHHPSINAAVLAVQQAIVAMQTAPFNEATGQGSLRYVQLTALDSCNLSHEKLGQAQEPRAQSDPHAVVQVVLVWTQQGRQQQLISLARHLWRQEQVRRAQSPPLLQSVWANLHSGQGNVILGPHWQHRHGCSESWQNFGLASVCLPPAAFAQVNFSAMDSAIHAILRYIPAGSFVVDLHAGVGTIGLSVIASQQARAVLCVEINPAAESAFRASLARLASRADMQASASVNSNNNKDPRLLYESLPSSSSPSGWQGVGFRTADVCQQPGQWIQGSDVVIVDPPRKGLGAELLAALCRPRDQTMQRLARHGGQASPMQSGQAPSQKDIRKTRADKHGLQAIAPHQRPAQRLVYLSCGLPALIRDLEVLVKSGRWQVVHAQGYLFFPGTDSIETLVVLDHVDGQAGVC